MTAKDYVSGAMENTTFYTSPRVCSTKTRDLIDENKWEVITTNYFHPLVGDLGHRRKLEQSYR